MPTRSETDRLFHEAELASKRFWVRLRKGHYQNGAHRLTGKKGQWFITAGPYAYHTTYFGTTANAAEHVRRLEAIRRDNDGRFSPRYRKP